MNQITEEFTVEILGATIAGYRTKYNPILKTIFCIHGWLDNANSFLELLPYLKNFNLICVDLPGHGYSDHRARFAYTHFVDYLIDIPLILDKLGLTEVMLLGHSMGGAISTMLAAALKDRIKAIALIDILGPIVLTNEQLLFASTQSINNYLNLDNKRSKIFSSIDEASKARAAVSALEVKSIMQLLDRGLKQVDGGYTWRTDPRLMFMPFVSYSLEQVQTFLKSITCEVMLVIPDAGWPYGDNFFAERIPYVKNLEILYVNGHHHVHMDSANLIGKQLSDFFNKQT